MGNTLTMSASRANTTKAIEFLNPATGTWQAGIQQSDGSFRVVFTGIPAGNYSNLKARLAGSAPAIEATWPGPVTVANAGTTPTAPGPVTQLDTTAGNAQVTVTVEPPADGGAAIQSYRYEYRQGTSGNWLVAGTTANQSYPVTGLTNGTSYQFRAFATNSAGTSAAGAVVTATPAAPSNPGTPIAFDYTTSSAAFSSNIHDFARTGYRGRSAFAEVSHTTDATSVEVTMRNLSYTGDYVSVCVYIDAISATPYAILDGIAGQEYTVATASLPAGTKKVIIRQGATAQLNSVPVQGFDITKVEYKGGSSATLFTPARKALRVVHMGDSISVGAGTPITGRDGYNPLLRLDMPTWEHASMGSAGSLANVIGNTELQQAKDYLAGATRKVVWWELGTNNTGQSAESYASEVGAKFDFLHGLDSTIEIFGQVPFYRQNNTATDSIREGMRQIAAARPWVKLVETGDWIGEADLADTVHPNPGGHIKIKNRIKDILLNGLPATGDGYTRSTMVAAESGPSMSYQNESFVTSLRNEQWDYVKPAGTTAPGTLAGMGFTVDNTKNSLASVIGFNTSTAVAGGFDMTWGLFISESPSDATKFRLRIVQGNLVSTVDTDTDVPTGTSYELRVDTDTVPDTTNIDLYRKLPGGSFTLLQAAIYQYSGALYPIVKVAGYAVAGLYKPTVLTTA
ncbi:fibronectin type III domain-containing protein [Hymenobacter sp. 102]|uniref:fibronectin type III domain-containing protein n=1 Tax=Hymenobacter sp. 102 TaxID=3403152 RepID=UPI003CF9CCE4